MHLTQKYYILNYHNYKEIFKLFDHIKFLEKQIDIINIEITASKQILLYLIITL